MRGRNMNIILALDQSTATSSAVVMDGQAVLAERTWTDSGGRNQQLFAILPGLLAEAGVDAAHIGGFAVGLGPGAFAGIRMSLSALRAWALPGAIPVYGVSSGEAIARDVLARLDARSVTVIGDARRHRFWYAHFRAGDSGLQMTAPYALAASADLRSAIESESVVVTPHWERIGKDLSTAMGRGVKLVEEPCLPRARTVGDLVLERLARNQPFDDLKPIYMHPPVFVEPRFPT